MDSPLRKGVKELNTATGMLAHMLGWASVEDVAVFRTQLSRVQTAIADLTDDEVLDALFGREAPTTVISPEGFVELPAVWKGGDGAVQFSIRGDVNVKQPDPTDLTAAARPDLSLNKNTFIANDLNAAARYASAPSVLLTAFGDLSKK